jgi:hypothetical protein
MAPTGHVSRTRGERARSADAYAEAHIHMSLMLCPASNNALISGHACRTCPAFVRGFSPFVGAESDQVQFVFRVVIQAASNP